MPIRVQTIHGLANSRTCGLWTIRGKTFRGQAGLLTDKLFEVIAEPLATSREQRSLSRGQTY